ncbi:protein FAM131C isoform X2 [Anolis sagrei]|uniref:protein FAM131C isoform X2 n=1 Tax=Anolis sagrei TaxID=38937 RepID=UPI003522A99A
MGLCVTKDFFTNTHKEHPTGAPQPDPASSAPQEGSRHEDLEGGSSGTLSGPNPASSASSSSGRGYNVTALANSSLVGLVQTIKDHITKPTAMAQGRVAHLIEWKGWSASQVGRAAPLPDEELYADLSDELKEARFAAGVAEQFAITEATLSAWSSLDEEELHYWGASQDALRIPELENFCLQEHLLLGPQALGSPRLAGSLRAFPHSRRESLGPNGPLVTNPWRDLAAAVRAPGLEPGLLPLEGGQESTPGPLWLQRSTPSLRYVDSSSLSEDDVFYN